MSPHSGPPPGYAISPWNDTPCRAKQCGQHIAFVELLPGGRKHPIDREPSPDGTIGLVTDDVVGPDHHELPQAVVLSKARLETWTGPRYVTHFSTCPAAEQFRRRAGGGNR